MYLFVQIAKQVIESVRFRVSLMYEKDSVLGLEICTSVRQTAFVYRAVCSGVARMSYGHGNDRYCSLIGTP